MSSRTFSAVCQIQDCGRTVVSLHFCHRHLRSSPTNGELSEVAEGVRGIGVSSQPPPIISHWFAHHLANPAKGSSGGNGEEQCANCMVHVMCQLLAANPETSPGSRSLKFRLCLGIQGEFYLGWTFSTFVMH